jgi:predicted ATPase
LITQIEIDGFKTFKDFKVKLAPFQVIVGPNGSGKSNLFDALHLLSRLADTDLLSAFQGLRCNAGELFTKLPDGQSVRRMKMAVEMLLDRKVRDRWGVEVVLEDNRLRYELEITRHVSESGLERLHITHEELRSIPAGMDRWYKKHGIFSQTKKWRYFIETNPLGFPISATREPNLPEVPKIPMIRLRVDGVRRSKTFTAEKIEGTVLSGVTNTEYRHAIAAREGLRSLRFLHLNPEALRRPSSTTSQAFLSEDGENLPTTLARMQAEDKFALVDVSRDMADLVPGILTIRLEQDKPSDKYVIYAETSDRRSFSSKVLSDGTLRLLALATLRNDPQFEGILCLEEPENGVHPLRLKNVTRLLREMATDFNDLEQAGEPLRQVLVTTHSPALISQPEVVGSLLFAYTATQMVPGQPTLEVTRMVPVITNKEQSGAIAGTDIDKAEASYTLDEVRKYLDSEVMNDALIHLDER